MITSPVSTTKQDPQKQTEQMREISRRMERVTPGPKEGNRFIYNSAIWLGVFFELFMRRRQTLIGVENLAKVEQYHQQGMKIVLDFDHFSAADIPAPMCLFWALGYHQLVKSIFFLIGLRWGEKFLCKGATRTFIVPDPLMPSHPRRGEKESEAEFNSRKREFVSLFQRIKSYNQAALSAVAQYLSNGKILWMAGQSTRSRSGLIQKSVPGAKYLWENADVVVPIALEGTARIIPIHSWFPRFWRPMLVIVGEPIWITSNPSANDVGRARAQLHIQYGNPYIAGEYYEELTGEPLPLEYKRKLVESDH